jgi:hypothetical protein
MLTGVSAWKGCYEMEMSYLDQREDEKTPQIGGQDKPSHTAKRRRKNTKTRRDKGKKLITPRDLIVLLWIAQQYVARLDQVQELLNRMPGKGGRKVSPTGLTLSAVLQVVDRWVTLGLVAYKRVYDSEPGWVWLTPYGLSVLQLPYARLAPKESTFPHLYHLNRVRLELERRHPEYQWVSERTLRAAQPKREEGVRVPHIADALVYTPKLVTVEVERSPKSPKELDDIFTEQLIVGLPQEGGEAPLICNTAWYFVWPKTRTSIEEARNRLPESYRSRVKILSIETLRPFEE